MTVVAKLLADLVAIQTHQAGPDGKGGNERKLCDHLAPLLEARGADEVLVVDATRTDGSPGAYVFARWGTPRRIINAHVDTVPANLGWTRNPWDPQIVDGKLYGLGSADTKGAIAAALVALDGKRPVDCGVLFSGDEEHGSRIMRDFLAGPHATGIREAIVCEPTARTAGITHRGVIAQTATREGAGGHSSKADFMPKPLVELSKLALVLDGIGRARLHDGPEGMTGLCMNVAAMHGGIAFNVVPQRGVLEWSIRPYPGFDSAAWFSEIATAAANVDPKITLATGLDLKPFACDKLAEAVRPFVTRVGSLDFWTEAALYEAAGIDAIVVGPGDIGHAHAADEHVSLDDLDWAVTLFRSLLGVA